MDCWEHRASTFGQTLAHTSVLLLIVSTWSHIHACFAPFKISVNLRENRACSGQRLVSLAPEMQSATGAVCAPLPATRMAVTPPFLLHNAYSSTLDLHGGKRISTRKNRGKNHLSVIPA